MLARLNILSQVWLCRLRSRRRFLTRLSSASVLVLPNHLDRRQQEPEVPKRRATTPFEVASCLCYLSKDGMLAIGAKYIAGSWRFCHQNNAVARAFEQIHLMAIKDWDQVQRGYHITPNQKRPHRGKTTTQQVGPQTPSYHHYARRTENAPLHMSANLSRDTCLTKN